ncbi:50S ribosomal protein L4 [Mycoplasma sp. 1654_15]|uniref:50S ribosomal protein L4 n=1 Tax=Mycoplasma sp. 1654_15 TaxID=2725994 RepID=UPI0014491347|nr:50S ribosomal protein L4 [Mycoplasma sp. 1654_15]QJB71203.1 50S ribosomal protein L4 [Mycoplasma sp. 1654_15]
MNKKENTTQTNSAPKKEIIKPKSSTTHTHTHKHVHTHTHTHAKKVEPAKEVKKEVKEVKKVVEPKPVAKTTPKPVVASKKEDKKVEIKQSKNVAKVNISNKTSLPKELFGKTEAHSQAIFDTILYERGSRRNPTHKVKSRAEVSGTGKKPWKQKGTGKARAGSLRSPIFVGGGRAFGPTNNKNYKVKLNKKVRRLAFVSALSQLAANNQVLVSDFAQKEISTKTLVKKLASEKLNELRNILIISSDSNLFLSARNLKNVKVTKWSSILVEDLVKADVFVISESDIKNLEGTVK